ncbi:hypothetical protein [Niabella hibiscisoli]|uniref:hypothetical protein n=1 Tax=Niabella hibiscisoli TaxID=1825928 RepID=UPI001F103CFE|nr:hypothetical protein [Niabella hibiscisoli]
MPVSRLASRILSFATTSRKEEGSILGDWVICSMVTGVNKTSELIIKQACIAIDAGLLKNTILRA